MMCQHHLFFVPLRSKNAKHLSIENYKQNVFYLKYLLLFKPFFQFEITLSKSFKYLNRFFNLKLLYRKLLFREKEFSEFSENSPELPAPTGNLFQSMQVCRSKALTALLMVLRLCVIVLHRNCEKSYQNGKQTPSQRSKGVPECSIRPQKKSKKL